VEFRGLFPTPVVSIELIDRSRLVPELRRTILEREQAEPGAQHSNEGGWQSADDFATWSGEAGRLLIDGHDVRDVTLASLRAQIGIVTQETVLFNDTVRNNIAYGQPHVAQSAVESAARAALAHEFIQAMPEGYATLIGERGLRLSGGERQRIAIARALLKNAPILILDEATSALDSESEALVQSALQNLMKGRTVFVIAHRLSTVRRADRIVVIENGSISDMGAHEELMKKLGTYRRLYDLQFLEVDQPRPVPQ